MKYFKGRSEVGLKKGKGFRVEKVSKSLSSGLWAKGFERGPAMNERASGLGSFSASRMVKQGPRAKMEVRLLGESERLQSGWSRMLKEGGNVSLRKEGLTRTAISGLRGEREIWKHKRVEFDQILGAGKPKRKKSRSKSRFRKT